ncbi:MAG: AmmeMemoRadiSam system radical SAM enzyme [Acidobacteria bacterium]|nr:AmmeMemoRadiSam system radical SAM enzyme [Acidobacteriota bacterium]
MKTEVQTLKGVLESYTREGDLYEKLPNNRLRCYASGHRCMIADGLDGVCRVRYNRGGKLLVPHGYVGALQLDPVEKKPFFHALPGALAMSFGMLGCDFHCAYCQNWVTSQALRDPNAIAPPHRLNAQQFVALSVSQGAKIVTSTYNEPLITSEWAVEIFKIARKAGLHTSYVSNGNGTPEVLAYIKPWVDLYKVDLKSFQDRNYRKLGGVLQNVLDTIERLHAMKFWLEIVTLIVPGFNDSDEELRDIARFLAKISPDIPWHVTAFHQDYKMTTPDNTSVPTLLRAAEIGKSEGLNFVYAGNLPGRVGNWENTYCPGCGEMLIERFGYRIAKMRVEDGACPKCARGVPGVWN